MKTLSILGSTGSIGESTLSLVDLYPERFRVAALATGSNSRLLLQQIDRYRPGLVALDDAAAAEEVRREVTGVEVLDGVDGVSRVATLDETDTVVAAISGFSGLVPTYRALQAGKQVALANKETLVAAGDFMREVMSSNGGSIIPVDSEHSALHQCLRGSGPESEIARLVLTASGGPFLHRPTESFRKITRNEALDHPTWRMGPKITIDSATMMNKGLEVIEAHHLFGIDPDRIAIVVHPQSVVHSMVEFIDGTLIAQLSITDMRSALLYALSYPERWESRLPPVDLFSLPKLEFLEPDLERFPCIRLAYEALRQGASCPAALNAANEVAVEAFLSDRLSFSQIPRISERVLRSHRPRPIDDIRIVMEVDRESREAAWHVVENLGTIS